MARLRIVDAGILYRNPLPGHQFTFAMMPVIQDLSNDEIIAVYTRGSALYARDLVLAQLRSRDGGRTWQEEGLVHDPVQDERHYTYSGPGLTRLRDGTLLVVAIRWDRSDPNKLVISPETGGALPGDTVLWRSADGGRTWSKPEVVPVPAGLVAFHSGRVLEIQDGRWFLAFDVFKHYDAAEPEESRMFGLFSADRGKTWGDLTVFAAGAPQGKGHWHGCPIELADGRLFALVWTQDLRSGEMLNLHRVLSDQQRKNWIVPAPTNVPGQTNCPVDLGDGRIAAVYTWREAKQPGIMGMLSEDEGQTWDLDRQVRLWDATDQEKIGVAAVESYPASHDTIAFGAPRAIRALNGDILACYWCTDACVTQVRWARLRME